MAQFKLSARAAETRKPGKHADGGGLYLIVEKSGSRNWFFIFTWGTRRPEMKLGSADTLTLAEARKAAIEARRLVESGTNPIEHRRAAKQATTTPTFGEMADALIAAKESGWRNAIHAKQWKSSLLNAAAAIRSTPVDKIDTEAVLSVLKPIWHDKPEAAMRLRQRIEAVLDAAKAKQYRSGTNPATWRGHLSHLLPSRKKIAQQHYPAMPYGQVPSFMARLREHDSIAARALEFAILTAARSGEVYGARWSEIDEQSKVWLVPADRMKVGKPHRVPLSERALEIVQVRAKDKVNEFIFHGLKANKPLSHVMMAKVLERLGVHDATPHGFRSSFRDWAGNETHFPREIAEEALAHKVGDAVERAYRRSDALERRRELMQAWANYCEPAPAENVVPIRSGAAA